MKYFFSGNTTGWINLAQDGDQLQATVNTVLNSIIV
jgi:hypothetical protein